MMTGKDRVDRSKFWELEQERQGAGVGRRRFKVLEIKEQRKAVKKNSFASRTQDPWNSLPDPVKLAKTVQQFRRMLAK